MTRSLFGKLFFLIGYLCTAVLVISNFYNTAFASDNINKFAGNAELVDFKTENGISISGNANLEKIEAKSLKVSGVLEFKNLKIGLNTDDSFMKVSGPVEGKGLECNCNIEISGPVAISDVKAKSIDITGPADLKDIHIEKVNITGPLDIFKSDIGDLDVTGPLSVTKSTISKINVNATKIIIDDALIGDIVITPDSDSKKQVLILKNAVTVKGNIVFEGKNGEVQMDKKSIVKGKIIGAKIVKK
jgi:hypothetical protein